MPSIAHLLTFALASAVLIALPGPSVLFVIGRSLALGRKGGILSVLGNELGALPHVAAVSLGVGAIVAQSVVIFTIVKLVGAAYLLFLGIQAIRHRNRVAAVEEQPAPRSALRTIGQGFLVGVSNPKTIVFLVAVLPQFVDYRGGLIPLQLAVLGVEFVVLAFLMDSVWALVAGSARAWFGRSPRRLSRMGAVGGAMMIGLGGVLVASGAKS